MTGALDTTRSRHLTTRIQRRLRTARARARYRLGIDAPHPRDVAVNRQFRHPVEISRHAIGVPRFRALFTDAVMRELAEAERLAAHRFTLLGHAMEHGARIAWSRDPVSGRDWSRGFSPDIAYRGPARLGDIKLPWELNKHQYFFTLGKAGWLTGDAAPAIEIVRQIDHWIEENPYQRGIHWISALETGTRAVAWMLAYPFYAEACSAAFRQRLVTSIAQHMLFVEQHLSVGAFANTHLVGEAAALVVGGLFLDCEHSTRWLSTGLFLLEQEVGRQLTPDGIHAERSVAYHRFFLDHYYLVTALLGPNGRALSPNARAAMERMTAALMHLVFPDGTVPDFGDADEARGLWMRTDAPSDYRGLLALGAVSFKRGDFKAAAGRAGEEVAWLLGAEGLAAFEAMPSTPGRAASASYPEAGYYVMRNGWSPIDASLVFDCGPLGFGPAGHGHADALSVQLHAAGYPFLIDSGTFSYNFDYEWRNVFRGTRSHNTLVVDGADQSVPKDRMAWTSAAHSRAHRWISTGWFDLADGEHDGYRRLADPVTHRRVVAFLKPDVWVILDELTGATRHEFESYLHVRPDCAVAAPRSGEALLMSPAGDRLNVWVSSDGGAPVAFDVRHGSDERRDAWCSPIYGTRVPSRALTMTQAFDGRCQMATCLSTSERARPVVTHEPGLLCFRVSRAKGWTERVLYRTGAARLFDGGDVQFDGTLLFHREAPGEAPSVWATGFHVLSLAGVIDIRSAAIVHKVVVEDDRCDIVLHPDQAAGLRVTARDEIRLVVNGRPSTRVTS